MSNSWGIYDKNWSELFVFVILINWHKLFLWFKGSVQFTWTSWSSESSQTPYRNKGISSTLCGRRSWTGDLDYLIIFTDYSINKTCITKCSRLYYMVWTNRRLSIAEYIFLRQITFGRRNINELINVSSWCRIYFKKPMELMLQGMLNWETLVYISNKRFVSTYLWYIGTYNYKRFVSTYLF